MREADHIPPRISKSGRKGHNQKKRGPKREIYRKLLTAQIIYDCRCKIIINKLPVQESFLRGVVCGSGCIGPPLDCQDIQLKVTQITIFLTLWPKNDPVAVVAS